MKNRVMIVSDHSSLHTGFANVSRHLLNFLFDTGEYEIAEFGWFAPKPEDVKDRLPRWKVYITNRTNPIMADQDRYGAFTLEAAIADFKPHVVLSVGDEWMVKHIARFKERYGFTWVSYVPIDGMPHPPEWTNTFMSMDICVAYGNWGATVMKQRNPKFDPPYIYHGVDTDVYKPDPTARAKVRASMGIDDDTFLIGYVGRNQPRKQIPSLFAAFAMWSKPHHVCKTTGKPWITDPTEWYINELTFPVQTMPYSVKSRKNSNVSPFTGKTNDFISYPGNSKAKIYLHCALEDVGWNIHEQFARYRFDQKVIYPDNLAIGLGVTDQEMNGIYNAFDIFTLPTIGEGFGLPILEAMSCGIPLCVTDYSAHVEWCKGAGELIKPITYVTEPLTSIQRAYVDIADYVSRIEKLYQSKALREKYGKVGRTKALQMDWTKNILPEWKIVVDEAIKMSKTDNMREASTSVNMNQINVEVC